VDGRIPYLLLLLKLLIQFFSFLDLKVREVIMFIVWLL
jgi:hypothetical protein